MTDTAKHAPTMREALEAALADLEDYRNSVRRRGHDGGRTDAIVDDLTATITTVSAALSQAEPEPVAWQYRTGWETGAWTVWIECSRQRHDKISTSGKLGSFAAQSRALYAHPVALPDREAIARGYVLTPEHEHPDSPHAAATDELAALRAKATKGPLRYQEQSDVYTHIIRAGEREFVCQFPQDTSGKAEAIARLFVALVNAYDSGNLTAAPGDAEPAAWIEFTEIGRIRFWTNDRSRAQREKNSGRSLTGFTLAELVALAAIPLPAPPAKPEGK